VTGCNNDYDYDNNDELGDEEIDAEVEDGENYFEEDDAHEDREDSGEEGDYLPPHMLPLELDEEEIRLEETLEESDELEEGDDDGAENEELNNQLEAMQTGFLESPLLDNPLYQNSALTLKQALLTLLNWQSEHKISLTAFQQCLQQNAFMLLPKPNLMPSSIYQLHRLLGIDLIAFEEHACVNHHHCFEKLMKKDWFDHIDDACPTCGEKRFEMRGKSLAPRKKFYSIPLSYQIQNRE